MENSLDPKNNVRPSDRNDSGSPSSVGTIEARPKIGSEVDAENQMHAKFQMLEETGSFDEYCRMHLR